MGGCGRFFEGTPDQMYAALIEKLSTLPDDTNVYCGHEYTLQNLAFAKHVEPQNENILKKIRWSQEKRNANEPTVSFQNFRKCSIHALNYYLIFRYHQLLPKKN